MANTPFELNLSNSPLAAHHMPRPRLNSLFDQAVNCKLVYVIAGAGYGKTQAVHHYISQQPDVVVRWVQLSESDNIGSHYWENLVHNITLDNPDLADKLQEFGFPETLTRFKQFAEIIKGHEHRSNKTFLVLDDFHLIHSKQALLFAERCAHLNIPGACVIIISRNEPNINTVSLLSKGKVGIISEDELRFTEDEIALFLKECGVPFSYNYMPQLHDATKGWAIAVKLLSLVLKRIPQNLDHALNAMKQNVFKLLETEAFAGFPEIVQKRLVQLSLISDLPLTPLGELFQDSLFIQYAPQLVSFIWFDSFFEDYRVHPLYLEFLLTKQDILSEDEKLDTYKSAAQWCFENNFFTDAVKYCAKSYQYDVILSLLLSYPFRLPHDTCEYFLNILGEVSPCNKEGDDPTVLLLKCLFIPIFLMGIGKFEEARVHSFETILKWENSDSPFAFNLLQAAYSNLTYIDMYTCTVTHRYDSPKHLKKSVEYYKKLSAPPPEVKGAFAIADIRSFACVVGEGVDLSEFDYFIESARETDLYIGETSHKMYYGYDELAACEIAYFKNLPDISMRHANNAIAKAREYNQHSIDMMAQHYLLRLAIHAGDYRLAKESLKQMRNHLDNPDFWNRQLLFDLFAGAFYALIELPAIMPSWIVAVDEKETTSDVHIPVRELIVCARYFLACKKYNQALTVLCNSYPREPQERFAFGELVLTLLLAVARLKTGDTVGAAEDFEKSFRLSFDGVFEMPFIELGKAFSPLATAVLDQPQCRIPEEWLKNMQRKASAFAKKAAVISNAFKADMKLKEPISLSPKEREALIDLYQGLSRNEMAVTRHLSVNTINKLLQSLFIKLNANNSVDAIRIAIEQKLIEVNAD